MPSVPCEDVLGKGKSMEIRKSNAVKDRIQDLWKNYLLSTAAQDMLLGEVAEHLYVGNLDFKQMAARGDSYVSSAYVETGFADDIGELAYELCHGGEDMAPFSELSDSMTEEEIGDGLFHILVSHIKMYSASDILDNPYYRKVTVKGKTREGHITLTVNDYLPGELIQTYHDGFRKEDPFAYGEAGFFDSRVVFPVLLENGSVWMSVVLSEIESMKEPLEKAKGNVITYGLGLGYYTFMASEKKDVESVTVVELNPHMISLFKNQLLPQFPHQEKIHIVEGNALTYVKNQEDGAFDFGFSDFWGGLEDGLFLYLSFASRTARFRRTIHDYWIENAFIDAYFRPAVMKFLMKKGLGRNVTLLDQGKKVRRICEQFIAFLDREPLSVDREEDIYRLLDTKTLVSLVRKFASENVESW